MRLPVRFPVLFLCVALVVPLLPTPVAEIAAAPVRPAPDAPAGSDEGNREDLAISDEMQRGAGPAPAPVDQVNASPAGSVVPEQVAPTDLDPTLLPPVDNGIGTPEPKRGGVEVRIPEPKVGGGFDAEKSVEVVGERDEFTAVYANPDGTHTAIISQVPQYFRTGRDEWAKVVPLFRQAGESGVVVADQNSFTVRADRGGVTVRTAKGRNLHLTVRTAAGQLGDPEITDGGGSVRYREVWPGVDVRFRIDAISVTKEIVLKRPDVPLSYDLLIDGVGISADERGDLVVDAKDAGEVRVGRVELFDKDGSPIESTGLVSSAVKDRGVVGSDVTVSVDEAWLKSLPAEAFPVVVDPAMSIGPMAGFSSAWARDTAGNEFACTVPDGTCPTVRVGNASSTGLYRWRSVFAFNYGPYLPTTTNPANTAVVSAQITLTYVGGSTADAPVYLRRGYEYSWCGIFITGTGCPGTNGSYQVQTIGTGSAVYDVTFELWFSHWFQNAPVVGWAMNGDETPGVNNYKSLSATMALTYNRVPNVPAQTAPADDAMINSGSASTPSVTLSSSGSDPDGDPLQYRFEVQKHNGSAWVADPSNSTAYSSSSSVVLAMTNGWDGVYAWRVWVIDAGAVEVASSWREFTTTKGPTAPSGQPWVISSSAPPTVGYFGIANPFNVSVTWKFELCEIAPGSGCGARSAPLGQDFAQGGWSYKSADFAQLGWTMQPGRRYVVKAYAPNEWGVVDVRSQFEVAYVPPPVVSTMSEVLPDQLNSTRPTFTTPTSNGSVGFTGYYFCVNAGSTAPQAVIDPVASACDTHRSGWVSSSYQLPTALNWGQVYNVRVWVRSSPTGTAAPGMLKYFVTRVAIENRCWRPRCLHMSRL